MQVSNFCDLDGSNLNNRFLLYKIEKITRLIKKIQTLIKKEGLQQQGIIRQIWTAFHIQNTTGLDIQITKTQGFLLNQYFKERLLQEGNKLAVSSLQNLTRLYNELKQKLNQKQKISQNQNDYFQKQLKLKVQQNQPSFLEQPKIYALSNKIKLEQQDLQSKINTIQQKNSKKQSQLQDLRMTNNNSQNLKQKNMKYLIQKLCRLKNKYKQYKKIKDKKNKDDQQQCNRKYGPKIQTQKYNPNQWEEVKKLKQRLLGPEPSEKDKKKKRLVQLLKRSNSTYPIPPIPSLGQRMRIRQFSHY